MPVADRTLHRRSRSQGGRQLAILVFASVGGLAAMWFLVSRATNLAASGEVDVNLGSSVFEVGHVDRLSDDIADVGPLLFGDLVGRDRDIYLQHIGDDPTTGWYAFAARTIDSPRDCFATWEAAEQHFTDSCSDTVYDETGDGLPHYPVSVSDDGQLSIDINADNRLSDN